MPKYYLEIAEKASLVSYLRLSPLSRICVSLPAIGIITIYAYLLEQPRRNTRRRHGTREDVSVSVSLGNRFPTGLSKRPNADHMSRISKETSLWIPFQLLLLLLTFFTIPFPHFPFFIELIGCFLAVFLTMAVTNTQVLAQWEVESRRLLRGPSPDKSKDTLLLTKYHGPSRSSISETQLLESHIVRPTKETLCVFLLK